MIPIPWTPLICAGTGCGGHSPADGWPASGHRTWKLEQADCAGFDLLYRTLDTDTGRLRLIGQRARQVAVLDYKGPEPARAEQLFYETFGQEG